MGKAIVYIIDPRDQKEHWLIWSSITDSPITYGGTREEVERYWRREFGESCKFDECAARAVANGCSFHGQALDDLVRFNRAGPNESCATLEQILDEYCREQRKGAGT